MKKALGTVLAIGSSLAWGVAFAMLYLGVWTGDSNWAVSGVITFAAAGILTIVSLTVDWDAK